MRNIEKGGRICEINEIVRFRGVGDQDDLPERADFCGPFGRAEALQRRRITPRGALRDAGLGAGAPVAAGLWIA